MITNMKFSECLKLLLSTLDISINRLAKAINVDSSLVNRWIHGSRIPPYNTTYIESISAFISKNILNTFQKQRLNELFLNICNDNESQDNIKENLKKLLLESQGYSFEFKNKERKESKVRSHSKEQISQFLSSNQSHFRGGDSIDSESPILNTNNFTHSEDLSKEDKIIFGAENVLAASIFLLEEAANQKCENSNTIYLTFNQDMSLEEYPYNGLIHWRDALLKAIENGWKILLLLRLNNNISRTIELINLVKSLIRTGRFRPYYIKKYDSLSSSKDMVIVPGIGALSCFSTSLHSENNNAFYLKTKAAVDVLKNYFNVLLATSAQPLVKHFSQENNLEYSYYLAEFEENIGNKFIYKYCFSVLTLPENLYQKLLIRKNLSNDEIQTALELYKRRLNSFLSNIQNYEYKDIYVANSIKDLIKHHQYYFYTYTGVEILDLEAQDIIEHLQNIINLLETYDNYSISFIPKSTDNTVEDVNFFCMVKERHSVLLETFEPSKNMPPLQLSIDEPMLVRAFEEYLKEIWEDIAPVYKDKKEVIAWIQSMINSLKK